MTAHGWTSSPTPRNGRFASCEGALAEVVQLARGILAREEGGTR